DVVVWSFRTSHSGLVSRLRLLPDVFVPLTVQNLLVVRRGHSKDEFRPPRLLFLPMEYLERLALFMTFGLDGPHMRRYIEYLKTRRYAVVLWQRSLYTDEARALVRAKGLGLIDVPAEVTHIDPLTVPEEHSDPPADLAGPTATA
ncbi:MAG: hypothetical protein JOZ69_25340, partial [Myxococcales bacterium]|nr:hypothetical protein [Myxococcales bacterium]